MSPPASRRRWRWRSALAGATALLALGIPSAAQAMSGSVVPSDSNPVRLPGTELVDRSWKNVGTWAAHEDPTAPQATITLIGSHWIVGVHHAFPAAGDTVHFPGGRSAKVLSNFRPSDAYDLRIGLLDRPIASAPGGYPRLLEDPAFYELQPQLGGWYLITGMGGIDGLTPGVAWLDPLATPPAGQPQPTVIGRDSGGVQLWRPWQSTTVPPIISGVHVALTSEGTLQLPLPETDFSAPTASGKTIAGVMRDRVAADIAYLNGLGNTDTKLPPSWTTLAKLGMPVSSYRPTVPTGLKVTYKPTRSAVISWDALQDPNPVLGYEVRVSGRAAVSVPATQTSLVLTDVAEGSDLTVQVDARNAAGLSAPTWRVRPQANIRATDPADLYDVVARAAYHQPVEPRAINGLTAAGVMGSSSSSGQGDQALTYCVRGSWSHGGDENPLGNRMWGLDPWFSIAVDGQPVDLAASGTSATVTESAAGRSYDYRFCGYGPSESHTVTVKTRDGLTRSMAATTPSGPAPGTLLPAPRNVVLSPYRSTEAGKTDYCMAVTWEAPGAGGLTPTSNALITSGTVTSGVIRIPAGAAKQASLCGLAPSQAVNVAVVSNYGAGAVSAQTARVGATLSGAPLGTALPAPVAPSLSVYAAAPGGLVDYCATVSFQVPSTVDGFPVDEYEVMVAAADYSAVWWLTATGSGTTRKATQCGLNPATPYMAVAGATYRPAGGVAVTRRAAAAAATTPAGPPLGSAWPKPSVLLTGTYVDEDGVRCQSFVSFWTNPVGFTADRFVALLTDANGAFITRETIAVNGFVSGAVCGVVLGLTYDLQFSVRLQPDGGGTPVLLAGTRRFTAS